MGERCGTARTLEPPPPSGILSGTSGRRRSRMARQWRRGQMAGAWPADGVRPPRGSGLLPDGDDRSLPGDGVRERHSGLRQRPHASRWRSRPLPQLRRAARVSTVDDRVRRCRCRVRTACGAGWYPAVGPDPSRPAANEAYRLAIAGSIRSDAPLAGLGPGHHLRGLTLRITGGALHAWHGTGGGRPNRAPGPRWPSWRAGLGRHRPLPMPQPEAGPL
jgi:hypothetical protein